MAVDYTSWETDPAAGSIELPGKVLALQSSQLASSVWALVEVRRKWWQFWLPETREKWVNVVLPESDPNT